MVGPVLKITPFRLFIVIIAIWGPRFMKSWLLAYFLSSLGYSEGVKGGPHVVQCKNLASFLPQHTAEHLQV